LKQSFTFTETETLFTESVNFILLSYAYIALPMILNLSRFRRNLQPLDLCGSL